MNKQIKERKELVRDFLNLAVAGRVEEAYDKNPRG